MKNTFKYFFMFLLILLIQKGGAQTILELEQSLNSADNSEKAGIYNQIAEIHLQEGNNDKAIEYGGLAQKSAKLNGQTEEEAFAYVNIGDAYKKKGVLNSSINNFNNALSLFTKLNSKQNLNDIYKKLSVLYLQNNNTDFALKYCTSNYETSIQLNDKKSAVVALMTIGDIYCKQSKNEQGIETYNKALADYHSALDAKLSVKLYSRLGNAQSVFGDYKNALTNLNKGLSLAKANNLSTDIDVIEKSIAVVQKNQTGNTDSQTTFEKQEKEGLENKVTVLKENATLLNQQHVLSLAEIDQLTEEAQLVAYRLRAKQDELDKTKLEVANKENEIVITKKDLELNQIKLKQQQQTIFVIISALIVLTFFTIFVIRLLWITKKQKRIIELQKVAVEERQKTILSSIDAALIIQSCILPKKTLLKDYLKNYFILFKPKDIVSGDFYWAKKVGDDVYFAIVDCTGHGVPGAFMSLHGYNILERILVEKKIVRPDYILNELNDAIVSTMAVEGDTMYVKNGMDISFIKINEAQKRLEFCGAKNDLYILRNGELIELKSDKMSIGHIFEAKFTLNCFDLIAGDCIYMYTDGYKDQKGGDNNISFKANNFKNLIQQISQLSLQEQESILTQKHVNWKGSNVQTDDICIACIKIN